MERWILSVCILLLFLIFVYIYCPRDNLIEDEEE